MRKLYPFLLCLLCYTAHSQYINSPKELFASDKLLHAGAGYAIGASTTAIADQLNSKYPALWGIGFSILASAGKEFYDYKTGGSVELLDAFMGLNGGVLGCITVTLPISKRKKHDRTQEKRRKQNFVNNEFFY